MPHSAANAIAPATTSVTHSLRSGRPGDAGLVLMCGLWVMTFVRPIPGLPYRSAHPGSGNPGARLIETPAGPSANARQDAIIRCHTRNTL